MTSEGYVIYVVDCETTGTNPQEHDVIELSMLRLSPQGDGEYNEEQKTWLLRALNPKTIQDEALKVNGHKREDVCCISKYGKENYREPKDILNEIDLWMLDCPASAADRIWAGQNAYFDLEFVQELYKRCDVKDFPFVTERGNRVLDIKQIITLFDICTGRRRKEMYLGAFVKALGIKKEASHTAKGDTKMTSDILIKLIKMIYPVVQEQFKDCYLD